MRWATGINHRTKIPPKVTLLTFPSETAENEVKIDIRGGGIYLTLAEAAQLARDLLNIVGDETALSKIARLMSENPDSDRWARAIDRALPEPETP